MNRYTLTKKLGDGTYGSVVKAVNRQTGEEVAVKKMKKLFTRYLRLDFVCADRIREHPTDNVASLQYLAPPHANNVLPTDYHPSESLPRR